MFVQIKIMYYWQYQESHFMTTLLREKQTEVKVDKNNCMRNNHVARSLFYFIC